MMFVKNCKLGIIIAAGGSGSRFGNKVNKLLVSYNNKPLFVHSLETFLPMASEGNLVVAAKPLLIDEMKKIADNYLPGNKIKFVAGGATRIASVANALKAIDPDSDLVAIHDGARPLADRELLDELCAAAQQHGGAIPGRNPVDTVKAIDENGMIVQNLIRKNLALVATPQVFDYKKYVSAVEALPPEVRGGVKEIPMLTDDAAIFMLNGNEVKVVFSDRDNFKVTLPSDLKC